MRKSLVFVALLLVSQFNYTKAQSLFGTPDTVCIRQPVTLTNNVTASTYYWGFCSGYLYNEPTGVDLGLDTNLAQPGAIKVVKDGANYYGFIANKTNRKLVRLSYGNSLSNIPVTSAIGDLNATMPNGPTSISLIKDNNGDWYLFATGGATAATSSISRIDFGKSLNNVPNSVNFGNLGNILNAPCGIFVQEEGGNYYGYLVNSLDNKLIRLTFGNNISFTPNIIDLGGSLGLSAPSDMIPIKDGGNWYAFITNKGNNSLTRLDFGPSITSTPATNNIAVTGKVLTSPSGISYVVDCEEKHLFITNSLSNDIARVDMPTITGPYIGSSYPGIGGLQTPIGISGFVRERDNLYCYVVNSGSNSISQLIFGQCTTASVPSSTATLPPTYSYKEPGTYNIYLAIDEGLPTMQVECRQIVVLPPPPMTVSRDTVICQGDTVILSARAIDALSYMWRPDYNITAGKLDSFDISVSPEYTTDYRLIMPFANGCIIDTSVMVEVSKNKADAGPDRIINDGAKTVLGGPMTTEGPLYSYTWLPNQFINDLSVPNPVVNPPYDYTYYLEVRNSFGCYDIDTVVVRVSCNNLNLPNAFSPESAGPGSNRFGVMNRQIIKLNYLRIFDRWGKMVFETTDVTKEWDGKINGEPAPFGVYVWEADGFCIEGKRFQQSGNVTLIR